MKNKCSTKRGTGHAEYPYSLLKNRLSTAIPPEQKCANPMCRHPYSEHDRYSGCRHTPFCKCIAFLTMNPYEKYKT